MGISIWCDSGHLFQKHREDLQNNRPCTKYLFFFSLCKRFSQFTYPSGAYLLAICTHLASAINSRLMAVASSVHVLSALTNKLNWSDLHTRTSPTFIPQPSSGGREGFYNRSVKYKSVYPPWSISRRTNHSPSLHFLSFLFVAPLAPVRIQITSFRLSEKILHRCHVRIQNNTVVHIYIYVKIHNSINLFV